VWLWVGSPLFRRNGVGYFLPMDDDCPRRVNADSGFEATDFDHHNCDSATVFQPIG
jgi:hypothetical protein